VKGNQPFVPVSFFEAKQRIGAIAPIELWNSFEYDELTINMRQSGDSKYASLLANLRVGQLNDNQYDLLMTRLITPDMRASVNEICKKYEELTKDGKSPIIILPRTAQCDEVNKAMLQMLPSDVVDLPAIDFLESVVEKKMLPKVEKAYMKMHDDSNSGTREKVATLQGGKSNVEEEHECRGWSCEWFGGCGKSFFIRKR